MDKALTPADGASPDAVKRIVREVMETVHAQFAALLHAENRTASDPEPIAAAER